MDIFSLGCFPVEEMKKIIIIICVKNEKKKKGMKKKNKKQNGLGTEMGYCPNSVTIQWKLYRDIAL